MRNEECQVIIRDEVIYGPITVFWPVNSIIVENNVFIGVLEDGALSLHTDIRDSTIQNNVFFETRQDAETAGYVKAGK